MKLSEIVDLPKPEAGTMSVEGIWYEGNHYLLGDDGDTLLEAPEPKEFAINRMELQALLLALDSATRR